MIIDSRTWRDSYCKIDTSSQDSLIQYFWLVLNIKETAHALFYAQTDPLHLSGSGDAYATLEMGNRLAQGSNGFPRNHAEAARLYSLASRMGYPGSPSLDGIGRYPLPPFKTSNPADAPAVPPITPLPTLTLVSSDTEGTAPFRATISIDPNWAGNAILYSWTVNGESVQNDLPSLLFTSDDPGTHSVILRVIDEHGRSATAGIQALVLQPLVTPTPLFPEQDAVVFANTTVDFQWEASEVVTTYDFHFFDGVTPRTLPNLTRLEAAELCSNGICTLSLPMELPLGGTHAWRVRARNAQGAITNWTRNRFTVVESITEAPGAVLALGPDNAAIFENLSSVSFGWLPAEHAQSYNFLLIDAAGETVLTQTLSATACSDTACTVTQVLDLSNTEPYQWQVTANNVIGSSTSTIRTLSIVPQATRAPILPENLAPENDAVLTENSTVTFQWTHDEEASSYDFHFFNRTESTEIYTYDINPRTACEDGACSLSQVIELPVDFNHAWRVRAKNSLGITSWTRSEFDVVPPVNEPPSTPIAITPLANALVEAGNLVTFTWVKEPFATQYAFEITQNVQAVTQTIESATVAQSACGNTTCSINLPLTSGFDLTYQWRVQATNDNGTSDWLETPFFLIEAPTAAPEALTVLSPVEGEVLVEKTSVAVLWSRAANATSYDVLLEDAVTGNNILTEGLSPLDICVEAVCSHTLILDITSGNNQGIRVRASNSLGTSDWTLVNFQVIDNDAPGAPKLLSPIDGSFFADIIEVPVTWQSVEFATAYELELLNHDINATVATSNCSVPSETASDTASVCEFILALPLSDNDTDAFDLQVRAITPSGLSDSANTSFSVITDNNGVAPMAAFSLENFSGDALGVAPLTLMFDPSASTDDVGIVSYEWVFGEGLAPVSATNVGDIQYTFLDAGTHTITLTVTDAGGLKDSASKQVTVFDPANTLSEIEASRFLAQATFGATDDDILSLRALGIDSWLEQQFALKGPAHLDYVNTHSNGSGRSPRHEVWWQDVVEGDDQLRQRVAFALSELFVISDVGYTLSNSQYGVTHFYDQLRDNAFGNYRQLLETVTKSPVMGLYLSMLQNSKADEAASTRPDENYAREVLQLFSIGLYELNIDGTPTGNPAYTLADVEQFARVFTGWNYKDAGRWNRGLNTGQDLISPMEPFEDFHDTGSKTLLLGEVVPAGLSATEDLELALDNIANHPTVGPFISKHLIQRLTTSNPSPQYVARVATVFNDNGNGVRGDLQAVVKAVLMDAEARTSSRPAHFGKLREPVMRLSNLWRAFSVSPGTANSTRGEYNTASPSLQDLDLTTGQAVLKSPSVFNFFKPEFAAIGPVSANALVAPEFEVMTESNEIATTNRIGAQINRYFEGTFDAVGTQLSYLNFDTELALADEPEALIDHLDVLLMAGNMSAELRTLLTDHVDALPDTSIGRSERVRDAVTLIMASPDYLIQQ